MGDAGIAKTDQPRDLVFSARLEQPQSLPQPRDFFLARARTTNPTTAIATRTSAMNV
jgi:hypothetical protein